MKLVLVDDSMLILKHAEQILKKSGVSVDIHTCQSGEQLLEICREGDVDIVLLDIVMPKMDGIEVLKIIKKNPDLKQIDVLMFSSLSDKETLRDCFELGATDYIAKPIDELEFNARIKSAVRKKNLEKSSLIYLKEIQGHNSELKMLNERLQNTQNQLIQQEKLASVGHLAAGVAHEINNPLGFVTSNIATLRKYTGKYRLATELVMNFIESASPDELNPDALIPFRAITDYIKRNDFHFINDDLDELYKDTSEGLERVGIIVKGLRNFSRVDQVDEKSPYNINEGIENTLIISRNEVKYAAEIIRKLSDVPDIIASGGQINQVILNMILNAIFAVKTRHEPNMGIIELSTWADEKCVHLIVSDNGAGIDAEHIKYIFNPFFTTKAVGEGTGLGLSISYDIVVNKHHGWIDVKSEIGVGTEFHITLPLSLPLAQE